MYILRSLEQAERYYAAFARAASKAVAPKPIGEDGPPLRELRLDKSRGLRLIYVYILRSVEQADRYYVGITADLRSRLKKHNAREVPHTSKYAPWVLKTYVAFSNEKQAFAFEKYLKSPSGRAFAKKRL